MIFETWRAGLLGQTNPAVATMYTTQDSFLVSDLEHLILTVGEDVRVGRHRA